MDAYLMFRLRFTRGLNIKFTDKWATPELKSLAKRYEAAQAELEALDSELRDLVISEGYDELNHLSEI